MFTFDTFRDYVLRSVEAIGQAFDDPADDWDSVFLGVDRSGDLKVMFSLTETGLLGTETGKDKLANEVLPNLIREQFITMYALVGNHTSYRLSAEEMAAYRQTLRIPREIGEDRVRAEAIFVMCATSARFEEWTAEIARSAAKPPRLTAWSPQPLATSGLFVDPLRLALLEQPG